MKALYKKYKMFGSNNLFFHPSVLYHFIENYKKDVNAPALCGYRNKKGRGIFGTNSKDKFEDAIKTFVSMDRSFSTLKKPCNICMNLLKNLELES